MEHWHATDRTRELIEGGVLEMHVSPTIQSEVIEDAVSRDDVYRDLQRRVGVSITDLALHRRLPPQISLRIVEIIERCQRWLQKT